MTEIMSLQTEEESHRGKPSGVEVFAANIKELFEIVFEYLYVYKRERNPHT